jgi:hypothetical protein
MSRDRTIAVPGGHEHAFRGKSDLPICGFAADCALHKSTNRLGPGDLGVICT